jgi:cell wall-associated NlpC family hydrolase
MISLIGIPYKSKGTSFEGVDCWGLVYLYHQHILGRQIPRYEQGYDDAESEQASHMIRQGWVDWEQIQFGDEIQGDVLAFRAMNSTRAVHCGVVVEKGRFLHCLRGRETCLEKYDRGLWRSLMVRIGRWNS